MTYSDLFSNCVEKLRQADIDEAVVNVRILFEDILGKDRSFLLVHGTEEVPKDDENKLFDLVGMREKHIPLQHLTGTQNFMGLDFYVSKDVLIPRFDTECLVEEAMLIANDGDKILDVCTGSGCILISLMRYKNGIRGYGCDISSKALEVANKNALKLCKPEKDLPTFFESDLFSNVTANDFDVIVSNPPYIRSDVIKTLMPEVRDHDPMLALDGGDDGLIFYRRIVSDSLKYLKRRGYLLVEIGHDQGEDVRTMFIDNGYSDVRVIKDLSGNDRVVSGRLI